VEPIVYHPIGVIRSPFRDKKSARERLADDDREGSVEVFETFEQGLEDLEGFSHLFLLFHFHLSTGYALKVTPFFDDRLRGVFSTRAPARPNAIGLSSVRLLRREGRILHVRGLDVVDGTPLLDIKPQVPRREKDEDLRLGWLERHKHRLPGNRWG